MADQRVAVAVITHNRCRELDRTLRRLHDLPEDPVIVVVDNGSTDGTPDMVRSRYGDVTLLTPGANLGAVARNLAVAVVNAHIILDPGGTDDPICEELRGSPVSHPAGMPGHALLSFLAGASVVRRSAFEEAGGFSRRLWLGEEEELLASDLASSGWFMSYVPDVRVHHHLSKARNPHLRRQHGIRNTLWFTWLRRPMPQAMRRTAYLMRTAPRDAVSARAFAEAARGLPWLVAHRQVVPPAVEEGYRRLDDAQRRSTARRYVS